MEIANNLRRFKLRWKPNIRNNTHTLPHLSLSEWPFKRSSCTLQALLRHSKFKIQSSRCKVNFIQTNRIKVKPRWASSSSLQNILTESPHWASLSLHIEPPKANSGPNLYTSRSMRLLQPHSSIRLHTHELAVRNRVLQPMGPLKISHLR